MVHGKQGLYLEAWKFGVYISIPIIASVYYSDPETQRYWADYWQYIKYPENPNTNVKEQILKLAEQKELQREQRLAYHQQLVRLQQAAERASNHLPEEESPTQASPSWWRRAGRWIVGSQSADTN
jgi:Pet100